MYLNKNPIFKQNIITNLEIIKVQLSNPLFNVFPFLGSKCNI